MAKSKFGKALSGPEPRKPAKGAKSPRPKRATAANTETEVKKVPDLDLRTLVRLSMGDWSELADLEWPPDNIRRWLEKADVRQVRGMLLTTLHRWHELRHRGQKRGRD